MNFADLLRDEAKWTQTWNGADALNTTSNALLDMYGSLAAMRDREPEEWVRQFELAWLTDPLGALRCLFYVRDVRGGQGERDIFRTILHEAAIRHTDAIACNLPCIPHYGRWDDLYALIGTPLEDRMWQFMQAQLTQDRADMAAGKPVSLLAKWLKKANSTNADTKKLGLYTAKKLGCTVYDYKRICSALRKYLDVTEVKMSANAWDAIAYEKVPSRAMMIYRKAFANHDDEGRFEAYLDAVEEGKTNIHSGTLYPYDIVEKILHERDESPVLDAQWKALPDYVEGDANFLVMADVSGSMYGRPLASSIALALYFAERNRGPYHNLFMTFSAIPHIVEVRGETIADKVRWLEYADWDNNTNFEAAMQLVLKIAVKNKCRPEDMPKALICVTDMDFDAASSLDRETYARRIRKMFAAKKYKAPVLVFWNVHSTHDVFHGDKDSKDVVFVAGQSAVTFRNLIRYLNGQEIINPVEFMYEVLNSERYQQIRLPETL